MLIKKYTGKLLNLIETAEKQKENELEILIKDNTNINSSIFNNVLKRIMGYNYLFKFSENEMLDIFFKESNIRITIYGSENINQYCLTNDINNINPKFLEVIKKEKIKNIDIYEYKLRFNLKKEKRVNLKSEEYRSLIKKWTSLDKIFRYKKRLTYQTKDNNFNFDMTIVRSSSKKTMRKENTLMKKKFIKSYMKKYIVKPDYVTDLNTWFDGLDDEDNVEMIGKLTSVPIYFKTLQKSNVLTNNFEYEIELEYIGNKKPIQLRLPNTRQILLNMLSNIIIILQSIQQSYYIISEDEKKVVMDKYKEIFNDYKFQGPMNITLEKKHLAERSYEDYSNVVSIRKGYSVTEKADGERNLLLVMDNGDLYMMNRKNTIKSLGANIKELANSVFDCEYIIKDKNKNNINYVMLFDIYFLNNTDLRKKILFRSKAEISENVIEKSRYEFLNDVIKIFETKLKLQPNNNLKILKKRFYFGDDDTFNQETLSKINELQSSLLKIQESDKNYKENDDYKLLRKNISILKNDTSIFKEAKKVYEKEYVYEIDGLVYTPRNLYVGEEPDRRKKNEFDGRWYRCFKWKPPELNSIDFLVKIKKDPNNQKEDLIKYININQEIIAYKTLLLHVGYNPQIHTKYNSFRVLNENITYDEGYNPSLFNPTHPYIKDICCAYVRIENDNIYTIDDKNIISDNDIIECSYDINSPNIFNWKPLRVRDNLKPNDFITANNVWNSINDPINLDNVINENSELDFEDSYYSRIINRKDRKSNSMYDFHSYIKKKLIVENLKNTKNLIDFSVGKAGDLNHWIEAEANIIVGVDINKDNLINHTNGACNRILNKTIELDDSKYVENSLIIWGDSSKSIENMGNDELSQYYIDVIYNRIAKENINVPKLRKIYDLGGAFDCVSCMFTIHYYFESSIKLNNYLNTVSQSLKEGGLFIGTYLDGNKLFDLFQANSTLFKQDGDTLLWKLSKKYTNKSFNNDESCFNYEIDAFNESIGITIKEYLVNTDYLNILCEKYRLRLIKNESFEILFDSLNEEINYGSMKTMTDDLKEYSFLNNYFIYQKY